MTIKQSDFFVSCYSGKKKEIRIVLLGGIGVGKSATGNTILGRNSFRLSTSGSSLTKTCSQHSSYRYGYNLLIVDTPGIDDSSITDEHIREEIFRCISLTSPGPHVFIVVLDKTAFERCYQTIFEYFVDLFGEDMYKYVIILFTNGDKSEESFDNFIKPFPLEFTNTIEKCCRRIITFEKGLERQKAGKDVKVNELLEMIKGVIEKNDSGCYIKTVKAAKERAICSIICCKWIF